MTTKEFNEEMASVFAYWPQFNPNPEARKQLVRTWFEAFKGMEVKQFRRGLEAYSVDSSDYFPTLPQLREACGNVRVSSGSDFVLGPSHLEGISLPFGYRCGCRDCKPKFWCSNCGEPCTRKICIYCKTQQA